MFSKKLSVCCLFAVMTGSLLGGAGPARADGTKEILEIIPQDAWGFVMARSLDAIDEKAKLLKEALVLPMIPDKLSPMALGMFELGDAVDTSKPICAVMLDAQKFEGAEKAAVILVPAKEPKALLEKLQAEEAQDGVSKCTLKGEPAFAAVRNKIVILGPNQDSVAHLSKTKKTLGDGLAKARLSIINDSDFYLSISVRQVVNAYKDMFMPMIQMMTAAQDPEGKSIKQLEKLLTEVAAFDLSIGVDDKGFAVKFLVSPVEDSDLQKLMADEKNTTDALLSFLPKDKFLVSFGSLASQSEYKDKFGDSAPLSNIFKMTSTPGVDLKAIATIDEEITKLQKSIKRYAVSVSALPEGSDGLFGATLVAEVNDSKAFVEGVREVYKKAWKASEDEEFVAYKKLIVHTADDETISGQKVDTIKINLSGLAERAEKSKKDLEQVEKIVGKDCVVRFSAIGDKYVALAYGGGSKRFETICGVVKSKGDSLSGDQGIADLSGQLPSPRSGEGFIAVDNILQTVKTAAKLMGEDEFPIDAPTLNAPIALALSTQDKSVGRYDCVVPMKLVKALKEAFDKYSASAKEENFDEEDDEAAADNGDGDDSEKPVVNKPGKKERQSTPKKAKPKKAEPSEDESDEDEGNDKGDE